MASIWRWLRRTRWRWLSFIATIALAAGSAVALWWLFDQSSPDARSWLSDPAPEIAKPAPLQVVLPELKYLPVDEEEAAEINAELPFSSAPIESAMPLFISATAGALGATRTETDCLTAAIYYEGGNEPLAGKRAIAQVILNRARHPAFPNSVCGVVYQGSERRTGCQFTFTCDGSLRRQPSRAGWDNARGVAMAALNGQVEPLVGMATHYHADYVVPYWASSLDKISKIGLHIFYRWKGGLGRRGSFTQSISSGEAPMLNAEMTDLLDPSDVFATEDRTMPNQIELTVPSKPALASDRTAGQLKIEAAANRAGSDAGSDSAVTTPTLKADRTNGSLRLDDASPSLQTD